MANYPVEACDALIEALRLRVDFGQAKEDEEQDRRLNQALDLLGLDWPLAGSAWDQAMKITGNDDKAFSPWSMLQEMLKSRGKCVFALSHGGRTAERGIEDLGPDRWKKLHQAEFGRLALETLAGLAVPDHARYRELTLNILIVDNRCPEDLFAYDELLSPQLGLHFWKNAAWWCIARDGDRPGRTRVEEFWKAVSHGTSVENLIERWTPSGGHVEAAKIPKLEEFDVVIQDQFLGETLHKAGVHGDDLAGQFYRRMPQALVFLATGTDIQHVMSLGGAKYVDRVISKRHMAALPWYYYLAFTDVMGSMLWEAWLRAPKDSLDERAKGSHFFELRTSLRQLVSSIRRWKREPEILWHGQALAEMVDHGNQHISDLWRLTDEILGARRPDQTPAIGLDRITSAERVLVALGVWLHDIGHRGDDLTLEPGAIRDLHGSISEKLLLKDPSAFALDWLKTTDYSDGDTRVASRNDTTSASLTPLRLAGLLCRHHQSSAPLFATSVARLHYGLKFPSDYARVAWASVNAATEADLTDVVKDWRTDDADLDWTTHDVRTLEDFQRQQESGAPDVIKCACLLRLCDALHWSRVRAGSDARMKTHSLYLENREVWTNERIRSLQNLLRDTTVGSKAYLALLSDLAAALAYRDLLTAQEVHLWRQRIVEHVTAKIDGDTIWVKYVLRPGQGLRNQDEIVRALNKKAAGDGTYTGRKGSEEVDAWRYTFWDNVKTEVESQDADHDSGKHTLNDHPKQPPPLNKVFGLISLALITVGTAIDDEPVYTIARSTL